MKCISDCTGDMDIIQSDGTCYECCNGNVPNASKTRCIKKGTSATSFSNDISAGCTGEREIYNKDKTECVKCMPYTRAQRSNTICLSDQCTSAQIITWLGTCADCADGLRPDANRGSCVGPSSLRLNTLAELGEEESTEVGSAPAKKTKSFPTVIVAGLGLLILVLSAATGMICYRSRSKTTTETSSIEMQEQN
jgi:hypothetical protein